MKEVLIVGIVFGSILLMLALIPATILLVIRLVRGGGSSRAQAEEAKMVQEIYQGLSRLEERIESLETILLDKDREDTNR